MRTPSLRLCAFRLLFGLTSVAGGDRERVRADRIGLDPVDRQAEMLEKIGLVTPRNRFVLRERRPTLDLLARQIDAKNPAPPVRLTEGCRRDQDLPAGQPPPRVRDHVADRPLGIIK